MTRSANRYRVVNTTRDTVLANRSQRASNFITRGVGLMGRKGLSDGEALIIQPCNSVVSFFMRFAIDVLFVSKDGIILHALRPMVPWRTSKIVRGSKLVVELPAGSVARTGTEIGDRIRVEPA